MTIPAPLGDRPKGTIDFAQGAPLGVRTATFTGHITDADLLAAYGALLERPDYDATLHDLVDLRPVTFFDVSTDTLRTLIAMFTPVDALGHPTRLAIIASRDGVFGIARMYEMLRGDDVPEEIGVFRSADDAHRFLGIS